MKWVVLLGIVALAGCGVDQQSEDPTTQIERIVSEGWEGETTTLARAVVCSEGKDTSHYTCGVLYETPEGTARRAQVLVSCSDDRCVWREQR